MDDSQKVPDEELRQTVRDLSQRMERLEKAIETLASAKAATPPAESVQQPQAAASTWQTFLPKDQPKPAARVTPPPLPTMPSQPTTPRQPQPASAPQPAREEADQALSQLAGQTGQPAQSAREQAPAKPVEPAKPVAPSKPTGPAKTVGPAKQSLEQRLGMRWLLIAGVGMTLLAAVFFFQYMASRGWINPTARLWIATVAAAAILAFGEFSLRRNMRLFAAGVWACGIVLLYMVVFVASPNSPLGQAYFKLPTPYAFACMVGVTLLGVGLSVRSGMLLAAVLSLIGAMATPLLLSTGENRQVALMVYLLIIDAGFLSLAIFKRWQVLAPLAMAGTAILFGGWFIRFGQDSPMLVTNLFGWSLFVVFISCTVGSARHGRLNPTLAMGILLAGGACLIGLWLTAGMAVTPILGHLLVLSMVFLAICLLQKWQTLAPFALLGVVIAMACQFRQSDLSPLAMQVFGWVFLAVFLAYGAAARKFRIIKDAHGSALLGVLTAALVAMWLALGDRVPNGALLTQLLLLDVIVLAVALAARWGEQSFVALLGTAIVIGVRFDGLREHWQMTDAFSWAFVAILLGFAHVANRYRRAHAHLPVWLTIAAGALVMFLWVMLGMPNSTMLVQSMALAAITLGLCLVHRWNVVRLAALAWTAAGVGLQYLLSQGSWTPSHGLYWSGWAWGFFALFSGDVLLRAWRRKLESSETIDSTIAGLANSLLFGGTYFLLNAEHHVWMGLYTAVLAAAAIGLAWLVRRRADRRRLAYAYLATGLVLAALAVPIQLEQANIMIVWAVEALVLMFVARRLQNQLILAASLSVMALAIGYYYVQQSPAAVGSDLSVVLWQPLGVALTRSLLVAMCLTASLLGMAALLRVGRPRIRQLDTASAGMFLAGLALFIYGLQTLALLPTMAATWWWLTMSAMIFAAALWRRSASLSVIALLAVAITAAKWLIYDTLALRLVQGLPMAVAPIANWQFAAGVALAVGLALVNLRIIRAGLLPRAKGAGDSGAQLGTVFVLSAALVGIWAGSFEIDRYFGLGGTIPFANSSQAMQMAYSLWWSIYAIAILVIGFVCSRASLRYFAIAIFAVTLVKLFLVDMQYVDAIYRILSFLGLGVLLVAAAWFYNSYFRKAAKAEKPPEEPQSAGKED